jgi:hypothetical protein
MKEQVTYESFMQKLKGRISEAGGLTSPEKLAALETLDTTSTDLLARVSKNRIHFLFGSPIAGVELDNPLDGDTARNAMEDFFKRYSDLFGLEDAQVNPDDLAISVTGVTDHVRMVVQQNHQKLPVLDGKFTVIFDARGQLSQVVGSPYGASELPSMVEPSISDEEAIGNAIEAIQKLYPDEPPPGLVVTPAPSLAISGTHQALVWQIPVTSQEVCDVDAEVWIDAQTGAVVHHDDHTHHGLRMIPVRHYTHTDGVKDNVSDLRTVDINVDYDEDTTQTFRRYSLQRLGSGRARIWNGRNNGATFPPRFNRTWSAWCSPSDVPSLFTFDPGAIPERRFNEQQTYYWAQALKTSVDNWGRRGNDYGHYPIDQASRRVNVEIIVNAHPGLIGTHQISANESVTFPSVMHGFFKRHTDSSYFSRLDVDSDSVPAVFLFNHPDKATSPQFIGQEESSAYSIVVHEVGHFISWQYGSWDGPPNTKIGSSLSEGFSMVLAALFGKYHWPELTYIDAEQVTTGSKINGIQWPHHEPGTPPYRHEEMFFDTDAYLMAWPFVQAMWHLMNNQSEGGGQFWDSNTAAIQNTVDLVMWALYHYTANPSMTWDTVAYGMIDRMRDRINRELEQEPLGGSGIRSMVMVFNLFDDHGLLNPITENSPSGP